MPRKKIPRPLPHPTFDQLDVEGVYLVHFDEALEHAHHYVGWAQNIQDRAQAHLDGNGSRILAALGRSGIGHRIVGIWPGADRTFERSIKNTHKTRALCPVCVEAYRRDARHEARRRRQQRDMQTFLPYANFEDTFWCLDDNRLKNQRNEALVILRQLLGEYRIGWPNHPAVRMWRGFELSLAAYGMACCHELHKRNITTQHANPKPFADRALHLAFNGHPVIDPTWLGNERFHSSHRAALLAKNPEWYGRFEWDEQPARANADGKLPYVWPI